MHVTYFPVELIGFVAGTLISISAIPKCVSLYRNSESARYESVWRNSLLVVGNALWVLYGIAGAKSALTVMCSLAFLSNGFVLVYAVAVRTQWAQARFHSRKPRTQAIEADLGTSRVQCWMEEGSGEMCLLGDTQPNASECPRQRRP